MPHITIFWLNIWFVLFQYFYFMLLQHLVYVVSIFDRLVLNRIEINVALVLLKC